jgi:nucleolysin TIA-1/TIAR
MNLKEETLWMGDIEPWMNETFIIYSFIECGFMPKDVKLIKCKKYNVFKSFCLVQFNNIIEANIALFNLNGKIIPRTNLFFKLNIMRNNPTNFKSAYVGNLSPKIKDQELFFYFKSKYPSVYYASIIADKGVSRGYGFVHFSKEDEYQKCLKEMNGTLFHNKIIKVKEKTYVDNKNDIKLYQNLKMEKENLLNFNNNSLFLSQQKDQNLLSTKSSNSQKNNIAKNIEIIERDEPLILNSKIQESINKLYQLEKNNKKMDEISSIILYYKSYYD